MLQLSFRASVILFCGLSLLGCTTMRVMERPAPQQMQDRLEVGDEVLIIADGNRHYALRITALEDDALLGRDKNQQQFRVHYAAIESIEYRSISAGRTISGVLIGALAVVGLGAIIVSGVLLR